MDASRLSKPIVFDAIRAPKADGECREAEFGGDTTGRSIRVNAPARRSRRKFKTVAQAWHWNCPGVGAVFQAGAKEAILDKQHIKGATQKVEGAIKDAAGKVTGSLRLRAAGKAEKAVGALRQAAGDVKDAGRRLGDAARR